MTFMLLSHEALLEREVAEGPMNPWSTGIIELPSVYEKQFYVFACSARKPAGSRQRVCVMEESAVTEGMKARIAELTAERDQLKNLAGAGKPECSAAAIADFEYYSNGKDGEESFSVIFPESLLWSSRGLAWLFESVRRGYLTSPGDTGFDEDTWDSFHLVGVREMPGQELVLIVSREIIRDCAREK